MSKETEQVIDEKGIGRREFLKKAGLASGAAAMLWITPSIISVGAPKAYAAVTGPTSDLCVGGKPNCLTLQYTANANATSHSQQADKVKVNGANPSDNPVWIEVTDEKLNGQAADNTWFAGTVALNGTFQICGNPKLGPMTNVIVKTSQNGSVLQTVNFHTSCSQPLATGDQFGSIRVIGF